MNSSRHNRNEDSDSSSAVGSLEPRPDFAELRSRKRALLADQQSRWAEGNPASPEELLQRWPTNPQDDPDVASLLVEDLLQRRMHGEEASVDDYSQRFPRHRDSLAGLLSRQDFLHSVSVESSDRRCTLRFPEIGDEVFGFLLRAELGKGAFARVFLAEQAELGGRAVAVKLSAIEGTEPQTLAQMQHTHIVPIYSVQEDPSIGLRAVCMPYFGGANLACVLQQLHSGLAPDDHAEEVSVRHRFNDLTHGVLLYIRKGNTSPLGKRHPPRVERLRKLLNRDDLAGRESGREVGPADHCYNVMHDSYLQAFRPPAFRR